MTALDVAVRAPVRTGLLSKRAFDLTIALVAVLLLSPVLIAIWLAVRTTSPGHALFRQARVGRNGREFTMYKFRSMHTQCGDDIHREYVRKLLTEDAPPTGGGRGLYKLEVDPRVTKVGLFLRRTSLDELPQLFNVIRGDMALVGPRPVLPWEAELFDTEHQERFLVPPGVTGLWQVSGRSKLTMRQGLDLDLEYVRRRTFWFDLLILLKTVPAVIAPGAT